MRIFALLVCFSLSMVSCTSLTGNSNDEISFYKIQPPEQELSDSASRLRILPFFIATTIEEDINEALVNKDGNIVAIVWVDGTLKTGRDQRVNQLFASNGLIGTRVTDKEEISSLILTLDNKNVWFKDTKVKLIGQ